MDKLKYIIDEIGQFMIFSPTVQHVHAGHLLMGMFGPDIVSAGFVDFFDGKVYCHGESISLGLKSLGEVDSAIIADKLNLAVGVN